MSNPKELTPETLRAWLRKHHGWQQAIVYAEGSAHADAWREGLREAFDRGWAQGRAEHLNPVLEAQIEALVEENIRLSHQKATNDAIWNRGT